MRTRFFYGYVILALCFINMVVMRGVNGSFGVYYISLLEEFGWSHSDGASIASVNFLVYALAAPLVGLAFDRFGPRVLMPLGGALVGIGLLLSELWRHLMALLLLLWFNRRARSGSARLCRPQCTHLFLVCAPARHRHRHRQHGPRRRRAHHGPVNPVLDFTDWLALHLHGHGKLDFARGDACPTHCCNGEARRISANCRTATQPPQRKVMAPMAKLVPARATGAYVKPPFRFPSGASR